MPSKKQESRREHHRRHNKLVRNLALTVLGGKCAECGFDDPRALQIDHIDGGGHKERKKEGYSNYGLYRRIIRLEIAGSEHNYQLLCANCNWIKRAENLEHVQPI